jgi:hypothetical protein
MMKNLTNSDMHTHDSVLDQQIHVLNYQNTRMLHYAGLRELILRRNKLSGKFAFGLQKALLYDKYLKVIDLAANRFSTFDLTVIIKMALAENSSIVALDARLNPGSSDKVLHQVSLCLLKNIEKARVKGVFLKPEWIRPDLYSVKIPVHMLHGIGLRQPGEKAKRRKGRKSKSKSTIGLRGSTISVADSAEH